MRIDPAAQRWIDEDPIRKFIFEMTDEKVQAMTPEQLNGFFDLLFEEIDLHCAVTTPAQRRQFFLRSRPMAELRSWTLDLALSLSRVTRQLSRYGGYKKQVKRFREAVARFADLDDSLWRP